MFHSFAGRLAAGLASIRTQSDRGAQTVDVMLWVGVFIAVVGIVGVIFRNDIRDFFNSLTYSIGF